MVDEKEESYDDEGEYHFSEDQENYDIEPETADAAATVIKPKAKVNYLQKISASPRRLAFGIVGIIFVIFIVYRLIAPPTENVPTEFANATGDVSPSQVIPKSAGGATEAPAQPVKPMTPPAAPQQVASAPAAPMTTNPVMPSALPAAPTMYPTIPQQPQTMPQQQPSAPPPGTQMATPQQPVPPPPVTADMGGQQEAAAGQNQAIMERLAALEEQNAKLVNVLQTQVVQRITENQAQNAAVQEKVHNLSKRLVNMEGSLNKMGQMLQDEGFAKAPPLTVGNTGLPPAQGHAPKTIYTVQAIIPGRAWLKSDAGETVTVAENDILKGYGKVVKIDPYDGVVEIDTGNKIIALSYGSGGE